MELSGVYHSSHGEKPHPQPSDSLCFYQMVKAKAIGKGIGYFFVMVFSIFLLHWQKGKDKDRMLPYICIYSFVHLFFHCGTPVIPQFGSHESSIHFFRDAPWERSHLGHGHGAVALVVSKLGLLVGRQGQRWVLQVGEGAPDGHIEDPL